MNGVDSKQSLDRFLAAAHFGGKPKDANAVLPTPGEGPAAHSAGKPKNIILPVPGVAPHLWHLYQDKKDDTGTPQPASGGQKAKENDGSLVGLQTRPQPAAEGQMSAKDNNASLAGLQARPQPVAEGQKAAQDKDNGTNGLQPRPWTRAQPQKATRDNGNNANGAQARQQPQKVHQASWESVSPKAPSPRNVLEVNWRETKRVPPPVVHWTSQLGIDRIQLPSGGMETKLPDLRGQDGHRGVARNGPQVETSSPANLQTYMNPKPFAPPSRVKPETIPRADPSIQISDSQKIPPLYRSFIPAAVPTESNMRPPVASKEAAPANGKQREVDVGLSRHLDTFRKTYKHRVESVSSQNSLPEDAVSTIRSYQATAPGTKDTGAQPRSDIRSTIAPMHHLTDYGDRWIKVNWNAGRGQSADDDSIFQNPTFVSKFILSWLKDQDYEILVGLSVSNHWNSDIETDTGRFLMPVEMPETVSNPAPDPDEPTAYRRQNMTSDMMCRREMRARDHGNERGGNRGRRAPANNWKNQGIARGPLVSRHNISTPSLKESDEGVKSRLALGLRSNYSPSVPCYLRPAEKKDMGAVTRIYNWEVTKGMQTLDSSPLSVGNFENILSTSKKLGMPFIVAVRGSARDFENKPGNFEFSPYTQLAPYAHDPQDAKKNGDVLGFAYLSVWEAGLAGDCNGSSRATARISLFVDPKYRRKKIGFSLLDKLLTTASNRFSSLSGYDFVDLSKDPVYKDALGHERKYFRLYLSYFVKHAHNTFGDEELEREQQSYDDDLVWVKKLLEENFNFTEKVRFETTHRSSKHVEGRPVYWLDSVMFEHTCHLDARFTTDY